MAEISSSTTIPTTGRDYSTSDEAATHTTANEILGSGSIPTAVGHEDECVTKTRVITPGGAKPEPLNIYTSGYECPAEKYIQKKDVYTVTLYGKCIITDPLNALPNDSSLRTPTPMMLNWDTILSSYQGELQKYDNRCFMGFFKENI